MKLRHLIVTVERREEGIRVRYYRIRYYWPARRGEHRRTKVDPDTFREKRNAVEHAVSMMKRIEAHELGRGPDPFADTPRDFPALIERFLAALASGALAGGRRKGRPNPVHVARVRKRLAVMVGAFELRSMADLERIGPVVNERLEALQRTMQASANGKLRTWSDATRDEYGATLRQFGGWAAAHGLLDRNPLDGFRRVATDASETFQRRALTIEEVGALMRAAEAAGVVPGCQLDGRARATLWGFAAVTGMRESQVASLRWADVRETPDGWDARVDASRTKSKRDEWVPLPQWLGERLAELRRGPLTLPVFPGAAWQWRRIVQVLRTDAVRAGLGQVEQMKGRTAKGEHTYWLRWIDPRGAGWTLDFHAFRHTAATLLDLPNVGDRDWADLVRHSDARMTRRYRNAQATRHRAIMESVPDPMCTTCAPCTPSESAAVPSSRSPHGDDTGATPCAASS